MSTPHVIVEFFGIPRQRAGRTELSVPAGSLQEVLTAVQEQCPALHDLRKADGKIAGHYRVSLEGERFLTNAQEILPPNSHVLILSADVGG